MAGTAAIHRLRRLRQRSAAGERSHQRAWAGCHAPRQRHRAWAPGCHHPLRSLGAWGLMVVAVVALLGLDAFAARAATAPPGSSLGDAATQESSAFGVAPAAELTALQPSPSPVAPITFNSSNTATGTTNNTRTITYEIAYTNTSSSRANIVIVSPLASNLHFVSASEGGVYDAAGTLPSLPVFTVPYEWRGLVIWAIPNVAPGSSGTVTLNARATAQSVASGLVRNQAYIKVGSEPWVSASTNVAPLTSSPATLRETTPGEGQPLGPGALVVYEVNVVNNTASTADIVVVSALDANLAFAFGVGGGGNALFDETARLPSGCSVDYAWSGTVTWTIAAVPAGGTGTAYLSCHVKEDATGLVSNQAFVKVGSDPWTSTNTIQNPIATSSKTQDAADAPNSAQGEQAAPVEEPNTTGATQTTSTTNTNATTTTDATTTAPSTAVPQTGDKGLLGSGWLLGGAAACCGAIALGLKKRRSRPSGS